MDPSHTFAVKLFASVREAVGHDSLDVPLPPGATVADLLDALTQHHPAIAQRRQGLAVAVNHTLAKPPTPLQPGDEVALIPPVGGG